MTDQTCHPARRPAENCRRRRRSGRADGGGNSGPRRRRSRDLRRHAPRRAANSCSPGAAVSISPIPKISSHSSPAMAPRRRICGRRLKPFRRGRSSPGAKSWASRPSSARAAGCFRPLSKPRPCSAPGSNGSPPSASLFVPRHHWLGWADDGSLLFATPEGPCHAESRCHCARAWAARAGRGSGPTAAGPKSSRRRESASRLCVRRIAAFDTAWSESFRARFAGTPLKGAAFSFAGRSLRGEAVVTARGIEGCAIYALSADLREAILADGEAAASYRPAAGSSAEEIEERLRRSAEGRKPSLSICSARR